MECYTFSLVLLTVTQYSFANLSRIANISVIAFAYGAIKIISSAYANAVANQAGTYEAPIAQTKPSNANQ